MTISLENVGSGFKRASINDNFQAIQDEINNNVLTKDGGKALTADLDFNSNSAINLASISVDSITLNGEIVVPADLATSTLPVQTGNAGKLLTTNGAGAFWEEKDVEYFDSVVALKAANLAAGRIVKTKQYYASPTNTGYGAATYKIMSSGDFGSTPDEYGDHTLTNTNVAVLQKTDKTLLEQFGATPNLADSSTQIQTAIDNISTSGGGVLTSGQGYSLSIQNEIDLKAGVTLEEVSLNIDLTSNPDYAISAQGSLGTPTTTTADISEGDVVLALTSVAGFTEGEYLIIKDPTRLGGRWPWTVAEIVDITGLNVTIKQPVGVEYLLANSCTVTPMSALSGAHLRNVKLEYSSTGTSKFAAYFINTVDCSATGLKVRGHAYPSNPTAAVSFRVDNSLGFVSDGANITQNPNTVGGNSFLGFGLTSCRIDNIFSTDTNFGVGLWYSYGVTSKGHVLSGKAASGNRGAKMAGCQQCKFTNVTVNKFDSGIKIEDSGQFGVLGCTVSNCGVGGSYGINVSHINAASAADIRPSVVQGNTVYNIDGYGIFLDANTRQCTVDGNTTRKTQLGGILCLAPDVSITDNFVFDWKAGAGIKFVGTNLVTGNNLVGLTVSTDSFELDAQPSQTDWTVFSNNKCSTHGITTNPTWFERVAVNEGNAILDWGGRVMFGSAAPTVGTFTRGDKVYDQTPSASGNIGWVCTGSGTPGVWKSFGTISA